MDAKKSLSVFMILITALALVSFVSADVYVIGKTYDSTNKELSGVNVYVDCPVGVVGKNTNSLSDGSYGIGFNSTQCTSTDTLTVTYEMTGYTSQSKNIAVLNGIDTGDGNYYILENPKLSLAPSTGSSGSGSDSGSRSGVSGYKYYNCGNGFCDAGEDETLCPIDCGEEEELNKTENISAVNGDTTPKENEDTNKSALSRITGAAVGLFKDNPASLVALIILVIIIIGAFVLRDKKTDGKGKKSKKKEDDEDEEE